jgi:hypothetical protein
VRCGGDQFFGLGNGGDQRLGEHASTLERVLVFVNKRTLPRGSATTPAH